MAGGSKLFKLLGEGVVERGKGVGARRVGEGGWAKGSGVRGGVRGWILYLNEVLNKTGIVSFSSVIGMHITRRNRPKSWGIPDFGGNPHCNDITFSKIRHNLARKRDSERFQP